MTFKTNICENAKIVWNRRITNKKLTPRDGEGDYSGEFTVYFNISRNGNYFCNNVINVINNKCVQTKSEPIITSRVAEMEFRMSPFRWSIVVDSSNWPTLSIFIIFYLHADLIFWCMYLQVCVRIHSLHSAHRELHKRIKKQYRRGMLMVSMRDIRGGRCQFVLRFSRVTWPDLRSTRKEGISFDSSYLRKSIGGEATLVIFKQPPQRSHTVLWLRCQRLCK